MGELLRLERAVYLSAEKRRVINGVSFCLSEGERCAIYGPSQSGKAALMRLCAGLTKPDDGAVYWEGQPVETYRGIFAAVLSKNPGLMEELTLLENAALPLLLSGKKRQRALSAARELFEAMGMEAYMERKPSRASLLQRRATCLARAVITKPRIYLADCFFAGLGSKDAEKLWDFCMRRMPSQSMAFLLLTDDMAEAERMSAHYTLREGRLEKRDGDKH